MNDPVLVLVVLAGIFFFVNVGLLRYVFRINRMIALLESIDITLKSAPWMSSPAIVHPTATQKRGAA